MTHLPDSDLRELEGRLETTAAAILAGGSIKFYAKPGLATDIRALIADLREARERVAWQPIESAPWEGPPVLLWKASTQEHYVAARVRGEHGPGWCTPDGYQIFSPTHWMPLPDAPARIKELEGKT